jgi:hypothetical protein
MIYYFTEEQWCTIWKDDWKGITHDRIQLWNSKYSKSKLVYIESPEWNVIDTWGSITGDEKDINWFLLQL